MGKTLQFIYKNKVYDNSDLDLPKNGTLTLLNLEVHLSLMAVFFA